MSLIEMDQDHRMATQKLSLHKRYPNKQKPLLTPSRGKSFLQKASGFLFPSANCVHGSNAPSPLRPADVSEVARAISLNHVALTELQRQKRESLLNAGWTSQTILPFPTWYSPLLRGLPLSWLGIRLIPTLICLTLLCNYRCSYNRLITKEF